MTAAIKQAERAGKNVAGATLNLDGSVSLMFGQGQTEAPCGAGNVNEWDAEYGEKTGKAQAH